LTEEARDEANPVRKDVEVEVIEVRQVGLHGIERHTEDLKAMFVYAPDTRIEQHPVKVGQGEWTAVIGVIKGTFTKPMPIGGGKTIPPTGKPYKIQMATFGHWTKVGVMDEEYLIWDNQDFMRQIGLAKEN